MSGPIKSGPKKGTTKRPSKITQNVRTATSKKKHKVQRAKEALAKEQAELAALEKIKKVDAGKENLVTLEDIGVAPSALKLAGSADFIWFPDYDPELTNEENITKQLEDPGVQTRFLAATEREVLFAGGRGSGKSDCLLLDPLNYVSNANFRGVLIRRTIEELREIIGRATRLYPQVVAGCKWYKQEKVFRFPSGATIEFGYCARLEDVQRYVGQEFTWLGIDEVSQYPTDEILNRISGSMRSTDPDLPIQIRLTTNPGGKGMGWLKQRFVDKAEPEEVIKFTKNIEGVGTRTLTSKWFQSNVYDNKLLVKNDPDYVAWLHSLPEPLKSQWLWGSWDVAEGAAFPEFNKDVHVVDPFDIPKGWLRFRAADWGYSSLAVCLWFAVDFDDNLWLYREYVDNGPAPEMRYLKKTADEWALEVLHREAGERMQYGVIDSSVFAHRGDASPSIGDTMIQYGCSWYPSDRSAGSRVAGKALIHRYLQQNEYTGDPKLRIFSTCKQIIKELASLPLSDRNPEDVDTDVEDHAYDALRYGLGTRPTQNVGTWYSQTPSFDHNHSAYF